MFACVRSLLIDWLRCSCPPATFYLLSPFICAAQAMILGLLLVPILSTSLCHPLTWLWNNLASHAPATSASRGVVARTGSNRGAGIAKGRESGDKFAGKAPHEDDLDSKPPSSTTSVSQWTPAAATYASLAFVVLVLAPSWLLLVVGLPSYPIVW